MKDEERHEPIVHIATAPNELVAKMWSGILEERGIRCLLKGGRTSSCYVYSDSGIIEINGIEGG